MSPYMKHTSHMHQPNQRRQYLAACRSLPTPPQGACDGDPRPPNSVWNRRGHHNVYQNRWEHTNVNPSSSDSLQQHTGPCLPTTTSVACRNVCATLIFQQHQCSGDAARLRKCARGCHHNLVGLWRWLPMACCLGCLVVTRTPH